MGAKGSVEAAKLNADNWGHLEVCMSSKFSRIISGHSSAAHMKRKFL